MERIEAEPFWLRSPDFADVFVRCEASKCLQPAAEIIGVDKVAQVPAKLIVVVVVEAFYRRIFDGAVHPLDSTVVDFVGNGLHQRPEKVPGNVDVEIADRTALELLLWLFVASDLRQPRNTVALKASMQ